MPNVRSSTRLACAWVGLALVAVSSFPVLAEPPDPAAAVSDRPVEIQALLSGTLHRQLSAIRSLLRPGRVKDRLSVIQVLSKVRHQDVKWILLEFLKRDPSPTVRRVTAIALGVRLIPGDLPQLTALLIREKDPVVRKELQQQRKRLAAHGPLAQRQKAETKKVRAVAESGSASKKDGKGPKPRRRTGRRWRLRLGTYFAAYWEPVASLEGFGMEFVLQLEFSGRHVIHLVGLFGGGLAEDGGEEGPLMYGGGVGYSFEWRFVRNILRLEAGLAVGYFGMSQHGSSVAFVTLRPTLHVALGSRFIFFSVGPRLGLGGFFVFKDTRRTRRFDAWLGAVLGFTLRL